MILEAFDGVVAFVDAVHQGLPPFQHGCPGGVVRGVKGKFLPGVPEGVHLSPDGVVPDLEVGLFQHADIGIPG